jgi:hypothetical protein
MSDLATQLAVIFLTQLIVSNATELGSLYMSREASKAFTSADDTTTREQSPTDGPGDELGERVFEEYNSEPYERTFDDYNELLITWGYCSLFVIAFPLAPLFGFISLLVESRIDGYKMCRLIRRPFPRRADDIGAWQIAIEFMTWSVLATNMFLICFESNALRIRIGYKNEGLVEIITTLILLVILSCVWQCIEFKYRPMPRDVVEHIERIDHLERTIIGLARDNRQWLNDLPPEDLMRWHEWSVDLVLYFLKRTLVLNEEEQKILDDVFKRSEINGAKYAKLRESELVRLGMKDLYAAALIIESRNVLKKYVNETKAQLRNIEDLSTEKLAQAASSTKAGGFKFTADHLAEMARYMETDLKGQAKRRLWERVDKDGSGLIEEEEMDLFLFFCILVFIKETHSDAGIPSPKDKRLNAKIISPLKQWLLHYKISSNGLSFDEFDNFFAAWLREYHRSVKARGIQFEYDESDRKTGDGDAKDVEMSSSAAGGAASAKKNPYGQWKAWLPDLVGFSKTLKDSTRKAVWQKLAGKSSELEAQKYVPKLLMIIFQLYHSKRQKKAGKFDRDEATAVIDKLSVIIIGYLKDDSVITYEEFTKNIHKFLQKGYKKVDFSY